MAETDYKIMVFSQLGKELKDFVHKAKNNMTLTGEEKEFYEIIVYAKHLNGWFDERNILNALLGFGYMMEKQALEDWKKSYNIKNNSPKKVGLILAGNIPFVGWHDILSVVMSGNIAMIKPSSDDARLTKALCNYFFYIAPEVKQQIRFVEKLTDIDAVVATGSNNSQRYFTQYFGHIPHIFRKNRNAVAVLSGSETTEELNGLANDMLAYYGLGCRNVSKLYLPKSYDLNKIFGVVYDNYQIVVQHKKYTNNFDYHKAIYLMNQEKVLENGIIILKEDEQIASPVSVCYYEFYEDKNELRIKLSLQKEDIQCVVSNDISFENVVPFGKAQSPKITDYADGVDTMLFLSGV